MDTDHRSIWSVLFGSRPAFRRFHPEGEEPIRFAIATRELLSSNRSGQIICLRPIITHLTHYLRVSRPIISFLSFSLFLSPFLSLVRGNGGCVMGKCLWKGKVSRPEKLPTCRFCCGESVQSVGPSSHGIFLEQQMATSVQRKE